MYIITDNLLLLLLLLFILLLLVVVVVVVVVFFFIFQMKCLQTGFPIALSVKELSNLVSFQTPLKVVE